MALCLQMQRGGGVRGHQETVGAGTVGRIQAPLAFNSPVHRVVMSLCPCHFSRWVRFGLESKVLKTRVLVVPLNSQRVIIHPRANGPEGVVIERVHGIVTTKSMFFGIGVKPFPDGGCTLLHRIEPRRVVSL